MILATDVGYHDLARAAGVLFERWADAAPLRELVIELPIPGDYEPGQFYLRELPCLLRLVEEVDVALSTIVVDGFVMLGADRPGLGMHLYRALDERVPVIGVAKTAFRGAEPIEVLRGASRRPLLVTAAGMPAEAAAQAIAGMHGEYRVPTLLRRVDGLTRL